MIDTLDLRTLQKECARALSVWSPTNNELSSFNKMAYHDSQMFYRAVLRRYVEIHGDLPSRAGPGKDVRLIDD